MKNVKDFQIVKVRPQVLLSICFTFFQFQPPVAYKSFAYRVFQFRNSLPSDFK